MQKLIDMQGKYGKWLVAALIVLMILCALTLDPTTDAQTSLEKRLEAVLRSIDGAGDVRVFINKEESGDAAWSIVPQSGENEIIGVLIVAQGAADPSVSARLAQAAGAALGADQSRIEVMRMQK